MLKTPEAAKYLGVSEDTMKRWRRRTQREGEQIGPRWQKVPLKGLIDVVLYDQTELDRWTKERTAAA